MKKLLLIVFLCSFGMFAQEKRFEKIKALKTAYITEQLSLSSSEAEKFWPIYNLNEEKQWKLRKEERKEIISKVRDNTQELSDSEANVLLDRCITIQTQELELQKQLIADLRKVLSPKKLILLKKAEEDFKRELLSRYGRKNKGDREPKEPK